MSRLAVSFSFRAVTTKSYYSRRFITIRCGHKDEATENKEGCR